MILDVDQWRRPRAGDDSVVDRCSGPTLDVGCGPGRMAHAVAAAGVPALGIDISGRMVVEARARGATALRRDVFGNLPAVGRWHHVLLLDGNIGIAANPVALLRRCRESVREGGTVLIELEPARRRVAVTSLRLAIEGQLSAPVPWARVGVDAIADLASASHLDLAEVWWRHRRVFAALHRPAIEGSHCTDCRGQRERSGPPPRRR